MWKRRWFRRLVIAAGVTPVLVALLGFLVAPPVIRRVAEKQLGELLGRRVTLGKVRLNPFALSLAVEGLQVFEADGVTPFVGFSRLYVNVEAASIWRRGPVVREVRLESPRLRVVRLASAQGAGPLPGYNFSDIAARLATPGPAKPPEPEAPAGPPPRFSLNNLRLSDGEITFDDRATGGSHRISDLDVGVPFVSTLPVYVDTFVEPGLKVRIDGAPFVVGARSKPFKDSLETTLELRLTNLDLTRLVPYVPVPLAFDVASAALNVAVDASFVRPRSGMPAFEFKGRVTLDHLDVRHRSGAPLLGCKQLEVVIGKAALARNRFDVERVALTGLDLHARRLANGSFDLEKLLPASDEKPKAKDDSAPTSFTVKELKLDAALHLRDETVRPALNLTVDQIALAVKGLSNAAGAKARVTLGLRALPGGTIEHEGTLSLTPLAAAGTLQLTGLEPARFAPYYRDQILFDVLSGRVTVGTTYRFEARPKGDPLVALSDAHLELSELALHRRGAPARDDFLRLGILVVKGVSVDLGKRAVKVEQISSRDGKVRAARDAAGVVDLTALTPPAKATASAKPTAAAAPGPAWTVELAHLELDRWGARFQDAAVKPPAIIEVAPIAIKVDGVSTAPRSRATVDVRMGLNKQGRIAINGSAGFDPLAADLRLDLKTLEILPLQPYFADQVNLTVTNGTVSVKGQVKVVTPPARPGTEPTPRVDFAGDVDIASFASLDGADREPLLGWKLLHVGALSLSTEPVKLTIGEVALTELQSRVVLSPDGGVNLASVVASSNEKEPAPVPAKTAATEPPPAPVTIGKVTLAGGKVTFTDRTIRPGYTAELTDLNARVAGLSSDASTQADLDLRGSLDHSGELSIAGKVNPLAKDLFVDLKVDLKGVELPPASPYAGKYAGYGISKGKLGLSLDYRIEKSRLDAKNRLTIDQFSFGDKVTSPEATKLPVRLAVALLKDRHGVIDIDLPIAGSLEDPQFKVWGAVWKVLGNLIAKAATAPFSLIASAFGGGDELSHLDFPAGLPALEGNAPDRIRTLSKVLRERPGLSFEIEGRADPARDRDGLRRTLQERKLRAQRAIELAKSGTPVSKPDELRLDPADRPRLLEKAYAAETFEKPKGLLGIVKKLPPAEMEKLMMAHTEVGDDDLRELAQQRAIAVQAALLRAEPSAGSRLFLVPPRLEKAGGAELRLRSD
jgi:uncharacterized protein involved in outer membrane biogenesis